MNIAYHHTGYSYKLGPPPGWWERWRVLVWCVIGVTMMLLAVGLSGCKIIALG